MRSWLAMKLAYRQKAWDLVLKPFAIVRSSAMSRAALHSPPTKRLLFLVVLLSASAGLTATQVAAADQQQYQQCMDDCRNTFGLTSCYVNCEIFLGRVDSPPLPSAPARFGAIAFDKDLYISGSAKDFASQASAETRALAMCRRSGGSATGCQIVVTGHNFCTALAASIGSKGAGRAWGYATSDDGWIARRDAVKECRGFGGSDCRVEVTFCTG